jgi:hypothetical protein
VLVGDILDCPNNETGKKRKRKKEKEKEDELCVFLLLSDTDG